MRGLSLVQSPYYHYMQEDENFRRWVGVLERSSMTPGSAYLRKAFKCELFRTRPKGVGTMDSSLSQESGSTAGLLI